MAFREKIGEMQDINFRFLNDFDPESSVLNKVRSSGLVVGATPIISFTAVHTIWELHESSTPRKASREWLRYQVLKRRRNTKYG